MWAVFNHKSKELQTLKTPTDLNKIKTGIKNFLESKEISFEHLKIINRKLINKENKKECLLTDIENEILHYLIQNKICTKKEINNKPKRQTDMAIAIFKQHTILVSLFLFVTIAQITHIHSIYYQASPMVEGIPKTIISWLFAIVCESSVFYMSMYGDKFASRIFTVYSFAGLVFYFKPYQYQMINNKLVFSMEHCLIGLFMATFAASIIFAFGEKMHDLVKSYK